MVTEVLFLHYEEQEVIMGKHFAKIPTYIFTFIPLLISGFLEVRDSCNQY